MTPSRLQRRTTAKVFTVGNAATYDAGMNEHGSGFRKVGRRPNYPGGFACRTIDDAARLIEEFGKGREWAIYELYADWDRDTVQSEDGWWHALINDATVIRKVSAEEYLEPGEGE